ncbi:hypothetical protein DW049_06925 [Ruminococcus sp. AF41-9]|nr:hypothetical protein DW049_06925 [Ruminococcus sp. AF41-9]
MYSCYVLVMFFLCFYCIFAASLSFFYRSVLLPTAHFPRQKKRADFLLLLHAIATGNLPDFSR